VTFKINDGIKHNRSIRRLGKFLPYTTPRVAVKARAEHPDGTQTNINTFPVNHSELVVYPRSDDPVLNQEAFRTWQLIRLPAELGGEKNWCFSIPDV